MHHEEDLKPGYDLGHPASMKLLWGVFGALIFLTFLTVWVADQHLGEIDLAISMVIAGVKASLVAIFFMHLNHDNGINRIVMVGSILFFALFLAVVLGDAAYYQKNITDYREVVPIEASADGAAATDAAATGAAAEATEPSEAKAE